MEDPEDFRVSHQTLQSEIYQLKQNEARYIERLNELQIRSDIESAINEIMRISLLPLSLNEVLDKILLLLLNIKWLSLDKKGSIFLANPSLRNLDMQVERNLGDELVKRCSKVPFGTCLCGIAASTKEMVYKDCVDADHLYRFKDMKPHGHYCVPIKWRDDLVGVLNLYVKHGHESTSIERRFLETAANALAGIIELKRLEDNLRKLSYEDDLTRLPNRRHFFMASERSLARALRGGLSLAILMIDLDKFKPVNDTYGHDVGDLLLKETADRMLSVIRKSDLLARMGGDEFALLSENGKERDEIEKLVVRLSEVISKPFKIGEHTIKIGGSIGYSVFPDDGDSVETLIKCADNNMYTVKNSSK